MKKLLLIGLVFLSMTGFAAAQEHHPANHVVHHRRGHHYHHRGNHVVHHKPVHHPDHH